jgi:very-short-patch-repair endonuclease
MSARTRYQVRVFSCTCRELTPTTPSRARKLLAAGVAKPYKTYDNDKRFAIALTTWTREEAFTVVQDKYGDEVIACWGCGVSVPLQHSNKRHWCVSCLEKYEEQRADDLKIYLAARARMMLDRALYIIEKQESIVDIMDYKEASEVISDRINKDPHSFDSSHEMVATMELLRNRVHVKLHHTIGGRIVDLFLPDEKIVLEIDGYTHKYSKDNDKKFDTDVKSALDVDWEIVRIPTSFIEKKVKKLLPTIRKIKKGLRNTIICTESKDSTSLTYRNMLDS